MNIMSGYDSDDNDVAVLICLMDYYVRKLRRRSRISKHVSTFSGHERFCELLTDHEDLLLEQIKMNKDCFKRLCTLFTVQSHIQEIQTLTV